jgi:hypothetical protein
LLRSFLYITFIVSICFASAFAISGCSSVQERGVTGAVKDGFYDGHFPYEDASGYISDIAESIKLVNCMAYYNHYEFNYEDGFKEEFISEEDIKNKAISNSRFDQSASGTATLISSSRGKVTLLTCAHLVNFPDTVINYYFDDRGLKTNRIESISIKINQNIFVSDFPKGGSVDILHINAEKDLAVLGSDFGMSYSTSFRVFDFPSGKSDELNWGTVVYLLGYPSNQLMLTSGLVSVGNRMNEMFIVDAAINRGFSGGLVLALRDGVPNFEFMGLVKSSPADIEYSIVPSEKYIDHEFDPLRPYEGELFVEQNVVPKSGITNVISIDAILNYLNEIEDLLSEMGYSRPELIND